MSFLLAPAGDQSAHLQWRLLHGELLVQNPPRVAVLMIGTNDLGAAAECFGYNATLIATAVKKTFERCVPDTPVDSRPQTYLCAVLPLYLQCKEAGRILPWEHLPPKEGVLPFLRL